MSPSAPDDAALRAARRLLAEAEQGALDEVLGLRAAATALYEEVVALRAEAAQMVEQAAAEAEALRAERAELDARAAELESHARAAAADAVAVALADAVPDAVAADDAAGPPDPLVGAQAEMRALSALLDELQGRVEALGQRTGLGESPP